jgi:hypothetical protein
LNGAPGDSAALPGLAGWDWQLWLGCPVLPVLAARTAPEADSSKATAIVSDMKLFIMPTPLWGARQKPSNAVEVPANCALGDHVCVTPDNRSEGTRKYRASCFLKEKKQGRFWGRKSHSRREG